MRLFEPHIHMTSRTTDDYQAMSAAGIRALVEPAFWVGQPRTHVGTFEDYFLSLLGWERFRANQFGIHHFCALAINPREANDPALVDGVLALLDGYLEKDGVVAVGEIGYDDMTPAEDRCLALQLELARKHALPALIHLPHRDKKRGLWRQSNHLVDGEKIWDAARRRDPSVTCAKLFWWFNMYSTADFTVTPRPMYPADGRKLPDLHTHPAALRDALQERFGQFPLFQFWGPRAGITSSKWIAAAAIDVWREQRPTLALVYLPHLDYDLQRQGPRGPAIAQALRDVDGLCGDLIEIAERDGARVLVVSEYGITDVSDAVHINRVLRDAGLLAIRCERGLELLDAGASEAFAVADHQIAHVYIRRRERIAEVRALLLAVPGIASVLDDDGKRAAGLDHPRSGELVAISAPDRWFSYYYWLDDARAPDFARTVDIHRKPGYDPVELFLDPALALPTATVALKLGLRKLGFRTLLDVIPLDARLVKGSHGRLPERPEDGPLVISSEASLLADGPIAATSIKQLVLAHLFETVGARG